MTIYISINHIIQKKIQIIKWKILVPGKDQFLLEALLMCPFYMQYYLNCSVTKYSNYLFSFLFLHCFKNCFHLFFSYLLPLKYKLTKKEISSLTFPKVHKYITRKSLCVQEKNYFVQKVCIFCVLFCLFIYLFSSISFFYSSLYSCGSVVVYLPFIYFSSLSYVTCDLLLFVFSLFFPHIVSAWNLWFYRYRYWMNEI